MGDRICLTIVDDLGDSSPVLYAHNAGYSLINELNRFYRRKNGKIGMGPADAMVNFISWLLGGDCTDGDYCIFNIGEEPVPEDEGYFYFNMDTGEVRR